MALTCGTPVLLSPAQPFQEYLVPVILDGAQTTNAAVAHGITGVNRRPDAIFLAGGGTSTVQITNVQPGTNPVTQLNITVSAVGTNLQTINLILRYQNQFP